LRFKNAEKTVNQIQKRSLMLRPDLIGEGNRARAVSFHKSPQAGLFWNGIVFASLFPGPSHCLKCGNQVEQKT
jgi:hypothetical protein